VPGRFGGTYLVGNFHGIAKMAGLVAIAKIRRVE